MKCPKCYFIGFDHGQRCKNCGYQFSLTVESDGIELPLKTGDEPLGPLADFPIEAADSSSQGSRPFAANDLPLFGARGDEDDRPLVSLPASPRAPVAVRKSSPAVRPAPAKKPHAFEPELQLDPVAESPPSAPRPVRERVGDVATATKLAPVTTDREPAPIGARLGAAFIDLALVLTTNAGVLYLTLKICGLTFADWRIIPPVPFVAFLAILDGGYLAAATAASGQTLGKLVAGIKVITADPEAWTDRVPLGQSILRSVGYAVSAFPAGLGFLPAFVGSERRALHDRLAHTRVVKA